MAADGGAAHLVAIKRIPDLVVGDLDSISQRILKLIQGKTKIYRFPRDKNLTDLKLALLESERAGASEIQVFSWADENLDYSLSALLDFSKSRARVKLINHASTIYILNEFHPELALDEFRNRRVSVFPLAEAVSLKSQGLRWELKWTEVPFTVFSQSNEVLAASGSLRLSRGAVFVAVSA